MAQESWGSQERDWSAETKIYNITVENLAYGCSQDQSADEKELVDRNYHKFKEYLNRID